MEDLLIVLGAVPAEGFKESVVNSVERSSEPLVIDRECDPGVFDGSHDFMFLPVIDWADLMVFGFHDTMSGKACAADDAVGGADSIGDPCVGGQSEVFSDEVPKLGIVDFWESCGFDDGAPLGRLKYEGIEEPV